MAAVGGWLALLGALALAVRARWPQEREWSRKLVHIGAGAVLPIAWAAGIERAIAVPSRLATWRWVLKYSGPRIT